MKLSEIKIDVNRTLGTRFWLVEVSPAYEYKDGVKTDNLVGYRYTVTLPEKNFEKIGVKVPGASVVTEIKGYVEVKFRGLEVTPYQSGRDIALSAKAESIEILDKKG